MEAETLCASTERPIDLQRPVCCERYMARHGARNNSMLGPTCAPIESGSRRERSPRLYID